MNPEEIESIPCTDFVKIVDTANSLHESVAGEKESTSSEDLKTAMQRIEKMKIKLDEAMGEHKKRITDLEAYRSMLSIKKKYLTSDYNQLETAFFNILRKEKSLSTNPYR